MLTFSFYVYLHQHHQNVFFLQVLMRALRDFNLPKIVTNDVPIFLGLISDLFPQLEVPRKRNPELDNAVRKSVSELHLQPEENFILKVSCFNFTVKWNFIFLAN